MRLDARRPKLGSEADALAWDPFGFDVPGRQSRFRPPESRASTVARPAVDAGSIQHGLVHPWGARPRGNGRQPEATELWFHAQDGGSRVIAGGRLTVQLPPRAQQPQVF